ncbi:hypothetical protein DP42_4967 [Burkholderia pseudomallei]|nr:hypothetical protein DP42_4967 [Burkholderia pseudomallei]
MRGRRAPPPPRSPLARCARWKRASGSDCCPRLFLRAPRPRHAAHPLAEGGARRPARRRQGFASAPRRSPTPTRLPRSSVAMQASDTTASAL